MPTGQPKNVRVASIASNRAELLWNEIDCELRHGRILGYDYELDDLSGEGRNISNPSTGHRVSLDDLTPYTEYRARVRGRNSKGEGPFSDYVTFRTLPAGQCHPRGFLIGIVQHRHLQLICARRNSLTMRWRFPSCRPILPMASWTNIEFGGLCMANSTTVSNGCLPSNWSAPAQA